MSLSKNNLNTTDESSGDTCVVCFKVFEIYSIGECDHPVCYECSTRMRVLCQQNECPICRQSLAKVIFTNEKRTYRDLEISNRSEYYNKKYKIAFANLQIQKEFYKLLDHPCSMCDCYAFGSFEALKEHVRKEHTYFYCDICTENLKIFSFERKCYSREDLGIHRRKGDADNKSHRGHPLCQYCDCRYLDRDELFRHLRREHYFCHFCDADGSNQFYADYNSLREHFQNEHYLCEEGNCAMEQFTAVFRSEIDLKAHISNIHGKSFSKLQAKQNRTLQLDITLEPRSRSHHQQQQNDQQSGGAQSSRNIKGNAQHYLNGTNSHQFVLHQHQNQPTTPVIDARNEEEFPSLKSTTNSSSFSLMRPQISLRQITGTAGLARTKENFPALGGGAIPTINNGFNNVGSSKPKHTITSASAIVKNKQILQPKPKITTASNRVTNHPKKSDFPALPGKQKFNPNLLEEDFIPSTSHVNDMKVSAKYKSLVEDYVSVANPTTNQKLKLIQKENSKPNLPIVNSNESIKLTTNDFPELSPAATTTSFAVQTNWVKPKRTRDIENRKSKVAPLPEHGNYDKKTLEKKLPLVLKTKSNHSFDIENNNKKDNKNNTKSSDKKNVENQKMKANNKNNNILLSSKNNENNNESKILNKNHLKKVTVTGESGEFSNNLLVSNSVSQEKATVPSAVGVAPLGFTKTNELLKPPPGFHNVTLNSIGKSPNNLTFTTSLGESYQVLPKYMYLSPPESLKRNQDLVSHFSNLLPNAEAFEEFRYISKQFREGTYKPLGFFEHCQAALNHKFVDVFPELLALLPDIPKQQDLYLVYSQYLIENDLNPNITQKLEVCSICKQIVKTIDSHDHENMHNLNLNFPSLNIK